MDYITQRLIPQDNKLQCGLNNEYEFNYQQQIIQYKQQQIIYKKIYSLQRVNILFG